VSLHRQEEGILAALGLSVSGGLNVADAAEGFERAPRGLHEKSRGVPYQSLGWAERETTLGFRFNAYFDGGFVGGGGIAAGSLSVQYDTKAASRGPFGKPGRLLKDRFESKGRAQIQSQASLSQALQVSSDK